MKSLFDSDNFASRRTTGHNLYDPESLISGREIAQGMTYANSRRFWHSEQDYLDACSGTIDTETILAIAPRVMTGE